MLLASRPCQAPEGSDAEEDTPAEQEVQLEPAEQTVKEEPAEQTVKEEPDEASAEHCESELDGPPADQMQPPTSPADPLSQQGFDDGRGRAPPIAPTPRAAARLAPKASIPKRAAQSTMMTPPAKRMKITKKSPAEKCCELYATQPTDKATPAEAGHNFWGCGMDGASGPVQEVAFPAPPFPQGAPFPKVDAPLPKAVQNAPLRVKRSTSSPMSAASPPKSKAAFKATSASAPSTPAGAAGDSEDAELEAIARWMKYGKIN
ncbi:unnamed protein product [Prorocentrum cordatum]|uniref:PARP-type domain-containing protein n=1 Tax=Prorocentrum cordatum TaxID=2364126 RepID=A0ABN9V390_9DINO|nr:unnamed protein product [Polarella glacialis]